jgi:hypothetical protein
MLGDRPTRPGRMMALIGTGRGLQGARTAWDVELLWAAAASTGGAEAQFIAAAPGRQKP